MQDSLRRLAIAEAKAKVEYPDSVWNHISFSNSVWFDQLSQLEQRLYLQPVEICRKKAESHESTKGVCDERT